MLWAVLCLPVRAVAIPNCDTAGKDALDGAATEVQKNLRRRQNFFGLHEAEMLVSLLDQGGGVEGPREILGDVDTQKLEAGDTLNLHPIDKDGGVLRHLTFCCPQ